MQTKLGARNNEGFIECLASMLHWWKLASQFVYIGRLS